MAIMENIVQWHRLCNIVNGLLQGSNVSLLKYRTAYLHVHIHKSLWYIFYGKMYYLTRLGFGLNVAPQIMISIVRAVLSQEEVIKKASSAYLDDVYINEDVIPTSRVAEYLPLLSPMMNDPKHLTDGVRVLGLTVWVKMAYCSGNGSP